jgi:hypothetical protein
MCPYFKKQVFNKNSFFHNNKTMGFDKNYMVNIHAMRCAEYRAMCEVICQEALWVNYYPHNIK